MRSDIASDSPWSWVTHERRELQLDDQLAQPRARLLAQLRVEIRQRLVEQDHRRVVDQRARERHALLLAAGELVRIALAEMAERELRRAPARTRAAVSAPVHLAQLEPVGHVVEHGLVRPQRIRLEHEPEIAALGRHVDLRRAVEDHLVADPDRARGGHLEPRHRAQQRGLAAARRPEERDHLAAIQCHRHALEDRVVRHSAGGGRRRRVRPWWSSRNPS